MGATGRARVHRLRWLTLALLAGLLTLVATALGATGARLVKDINLGGDSSPAQLTNVRGRLFFSAEDGSHGHELWKSDGTRAGTRLVKDINPGGGSYPLGLTKVDGRLFFRADDGSHGEELWKAAP